MEQEPTECRRKPYRPWLSDHLMPKRHVQNDRKRPLLSDQSVVLPPKEGSERFEMQFRKTFVPLFLKKSHSLKAICASIMVYISLKEKGMDELIK
jgi:hypothetical protein